MKRISSNIFSTVTTQGGMFPPEFLQRIFDLDKDVQGLTAADYYLPEHRRIQEKANSAWSELLIDWKAFKAKTDHLEADVAVTGITRDQWLLPLFEQLGYGRLKKAGNTEIEGKVYPVSHFHEQSPVHLVGWNINLDTRSAGVAGAARFAPHGMVQEFLNRSDEHLWGFVSNGRKLRILRDNVSMTRQAYVEFDLESMMEGECFSDFVLLWLLCHHSRVEVPLVEEGSPRNPATCWLERWSREAETQGARMRDHLREGVEKAIQAFGSGFLSHPANQQLRERLRDGNLDKQDYYRQLLRLVYRLIFLFVAEDRDLLHDGVADAQKKQLYFNHYSTQRIRRIAETKRGTQHRDLWETLKLLFGWLSTEDGCDKLGLAPLGGFLFGDAAMPDLMASKIANVDLLNAIRCLAVTDGDGARRPVDYRNLGAEELGSIYESLLEMHPNLHLEAHTFELDVAAGNERKSTGSYYTPKPLVNCLLDSALDPVVADRLIKAKKQAIANQQPVAQVQEEALLNLKVCDPACGSGHFLIGAAHRIAKHLASVRSGDVEPSPEATHHALRDVITHCIYGVDINPMSVELCKVSLWMEAMEPGKPLGFLSHHIKCGNSLLGTTPALLSRGIPDAAFKPIEGDDRTVCNQLKRRNREERDRILDDLFTFTAAEWSQNAFEAALKDVESLSDNDIQSREKKQLAYESFLQSTAYCGSKRLHDAWCAAFVQPKLPKSSKDYQEPITQQLIREMQQDPNRCPEAQRKLIDNLAEQYNFFHWHIEFPDVFQPLESFAETDSKGWNGGFDCMLGNPPWERIKLQEKEWFSARDPEIANARNAAARKRRIKELINNNPPLHAAFLRDKRLAEGESVLARNSGRFPLCGRGDVNTYTIFAETFKDCISKTGRSGVIVPSGIATDDTTKFFFQDLVESKGLVSLFDFENRKKIFPAVDSRMKFCLLTMGGAGAMPSEGANFSFFALDVEDLKDTERVFALSAEDIELINPNTRTCPVFRTRRDAELTISIYRHIPVLVSADAGVTTQGWGFDYMTKMFDMADSSYEFLEYESLINSGCDRRSFCWDMSENQRYCPLYEAKNIHLFDHRWAETVADEQSGREDLKQLPDYFINTRYWVDCKRVGERLESKSWNNEWLLGWRDITNVTNERTAIFSVFPKTAAAHTLRVAFLKASARQVSVFLGNVSSLVFDYIVRQKVGGTHLTVECVKQLPVLPLEMIGAVSQYRIVERVLELVYTSQDIAAFAADSSYSAPPFIWDEYRRFEIRCELDAAFFHLYGIDDIADVDYIMETFPIVKRKDEAKYGTYRTKERILEIYQEMTLCTVEGREYQTALNPPPGPPVDADGNFIPMSEWDCDNWPPHIHRPKEEIEELEPAVSVSAERYPFDAETYAYRILPQLIREGGGSLPVTQAAMAYALLADTELRGQVDNICTFDWRKNFNQVVEVSQFRVALERLVKQEFVCWVGDGLHGRLELDKWAKDEVAACIIEDAKQALMMARKLPKPLQQSSKTIKQIMEAVAA